MTTTATKTEQSKQKRPLSEKMARACEEAQGGICHCRCRGAYHGRTAQKDGAALPFQFYNDLSKDDPHWLPTDEQKEAHKKDLYEQRKLNNKLKTAGKWHVYGGRCKGFEPVVLSKEEAAAKDKNFNKYMPGRYFGCANCDRVERIY